MVNKIIKKIIYAGISFALIFITKAIMTKDIHAISQNAVYIVDEECVINVKQRTTQELERDLHGCALFHEILTK